MTVLTIRLPDEKQKRLRALAKARRMSLNKLIEELSTIAFFTILAIMVNGAF